MVEIFERISEIGIIPVIAINDAENAVPLAKALVAGGIAVAEVTFRTAQGEEAIRRIATEMPQILVGAGTVLTTEQVDRAAAVGAKFIVSPGFNPRVVTRCLEIGAPVVPGCSSPSDIESALDFGLNVVKFFPAEQAGGLDYIKAIAAPYSSVKFIPTGGINEDNIGKYLSFEKVLACGGSWMVAANLIDRGNFDEITRLCEEAIRRTHGFEIAHIGINSASDKEAAGIADMFSLAFGFPRKDGNSSIFAGSSIEVMKPPYFGKNGHIAIRTNSVKRAKRYLNTMGFTFDESSEKDDEKGNPTLIYLAKEFGGFAVHLVQKK